MHFWMRISVMWLTGSGNCVLWRNSSRAYVSVAAMLSLPQTAEFSVRCLGRPTIKIRENLQRVTSANLTLPLREKVDLLATG